MEYRKYRLEMVRETTVTDSYDYRFKTSEDAAAFLKSIRLDMSDRERVVVLALAADGSLIGFTEVSVGELSSAVIHPREVLKYAVICNAAAIIMAHNHPSGSLIPSEEDKEVVRRINDCCNLMGIKMVDNLIVSEKGYTSLMKLI